MNFQCRQRRRWAGKQANNITCRHAAFVFVLGNSETYSNCRRADKKNKKITDSCCYSKAVYCAVGDSRYKCHYGHKLWPYFFALSLCASLWGASPFHATQSNQAELTKWYLRLLQLRITLLWSCMVPSLSPHMYQHCSKRNLMWNSPNQAKARLWRTSAACLSFFFFFTQQTDRQMSES